jgi:hypothetical protein
VGCSVQHAGTAALGVINCSSSGQIFPLNEATLASTTAISAGSGSAGIFYTGSALTSKAFRILGYLEWSATGLTAGTWTTTNLLQVQSFGAGIKRPGDSIQRILQSSSTSSTTTSGTYVATNNAQAISPTSAANFIKVEAFGESQLSTAGQRGLYSLLRGSTQFGSIASLLINQASGFSFLNSPVSLVGYDKPNTTSSTTYAVGMASGNGVVTVQWLDGSSVSTGILILEEIQT